MRLVLTLVLALAVFASPALADPPAATSTQRTFSEEKVKVVTGEFELPGKITLPDGDGPFPAIVLVHGSGPHDMDETIGPHKVFKDFADGLAAQGVATLRYEKRTHKYGAAMSVEKVTLDKEVVNDAVSAVKLAQSNPRIDPKRVFVLGHSLGGTCAPLIAVRAPQLAGFISLSGTPRSLLDVIDDQMEYILHLEEMTPKKQEQLDEIHKTTQLIREGKLKEVKTPLLGAPSTYWAECHKLDVITPARKFGKPILIIGGGRDYQVSPKCFDAWKAGLKGCPNVTYKWFDNVNHLMVKGEGMGTPDEYFQPGHVSKKVIREIAEWVKSDGAGS
ncbi:MAG TPA: alpha/beta fold hydrolase [Phycisphaerae bacterium]|nr:alpha/beta fold hydrolase [Phycisphaerae bacterium]